MLTGYGLEIAVTEGDPKPLCMGDEWVVFSNETAARMAAMMLEALTCESYQIVNLEERLNAEERNA